MPALPKETVRDSFGELDVVRLRSVVYTEDGDLPVGSIGTIVFRHPRDEAYEVEFAAPVPAVVTLRIGDLALAG